MADAGEFRITEDDLSGAPVQALIALHLKAVSSHSPANSVHALDIDRLRRPDVTFWTLWEGDALLGCGALKELGGTEGEIKSMRTDPAALGRGVGAAILRHIIAEAKARGYARLNLETGTGPAFEPAHRLYLRHGFTDCPPFADYRNDPFSRFMTLSL
ncbi:GNAT family N-acetyltransferase [Sphingomonas sp. GlSt437]|uniref:GNAT family N-acetyltransferase n=1 Tax=Sphingomonas sp. GlSt437 TaxID=3389970 RepID=UPI003A8C5210